MVLGRNDKRKRKEGDLVDLMDPASAAPKRAKVHAQRKFAQGVATIFSPVAPLVKEKERPKSTLVTELITHKRPNTEDFLTFLCFRGTSILPPSLNFFSHGSKKEKFDSKNPRKSTPSQSSSSPNPPPAPTPSKTEENPQKPPEKPPTISKPSTPSNPPKKKFPVIHKPVTVNKYKTATSTVQALKKKYKEQRLAKQRVENKLKTSVMRTRSSASRTLLTSSNKLIPNVFLKHIEKKSLCLRSSGALEPTSTISKSKLLPKNKKKPLKKKIEENESSDESSEDQSTPKKSLKPKVKQKEIVKSKIVSGKNKSDSGRRVTRSHRETTPVATSQPNQRPSRKTKEAAAVYMEILSRKLVSPDLDHDDNLSLDSFPEIPNARRDSAAKKALSDKKKGLSNNKKRNDSEERGKIAGKTKRNVKVVKYSDSDDNSSMQSDKSNQTSVKTRAITRKNTNLVTKSSLGTRNLRSTVKTSDIKSDKSSKSSVKQILNPLKDKKKLKIKRKSDKESNFPKGGNSFVKYSGDKTKKLLKKKSESQESESDEEPLGTVLNRINKNKPGKSLVKRPNKPTDSIKKFPQNEPVIMIKKIAKIPGKTTSEDEGSFRGFGKKSLKALSSTCSLKMNNDAPKIAKTEETDGKFDSLKASETQKSIVSQEKSTKNETEKLEDSVEHSSISINKKELTKKKPSTPAVPSPPQIFEKMRNFIDVPTLQSMGRKERVNMSTEQIEKWLNESSMVKEESKAEMETVINYPFGIEGEKTKFSVPNVLNIPNIPSPITIPSVPNPQNCHLSIPTRIQHLVRPVNVAIAKIAEKQINTIDLSPHNFPKQLKQDIILSSTGIATAKCLTIPTNRNKINADIKEIIKGRTIKAVESPSPEKTNQVTADTDNESDINSFKVISDNETITTTPSPNDKKKNQGRKPFVSKVKERKLSIPNSNAFSPEDESSVYAFKSETEAPVNTPFRRKIRDNKMESPININETPKKSSEGSTIGKKPSGTKEVDKNENPSNQLDPTAIEHLSNVFKNVPSIWNNECGTSIAVQINFNENQESSSANNPFYRQNIVFDDTKKGNESTSNEISTQTENSNSNEDENNTTQVFYIPLENVGRNISHLTNLQGQSLIQGVAVKLGTEGPNGPNQRVLLRAQLVTKPPITVTRCPPIGTVQPTTRNPQGSDPIPSTSSVIPSTSSVTPTKIDESTTNNDQETPEKIKKPSKPSVPRENKKKSSELLKPKVTEKEKRQEKRSKKTSTSSTEVSTSLSSQIGSHSSDTSTPENKARLADAPTFHPTEKDFQDPLEYIEKIRPLAEKYGICKVIPPSNFKPECKISDDMRFTAYNQYVHRMLHRWGPNVKEMMAIKKYLATQSITLSQPPWIGGMEVDLPHLYQTVQSLGGLKEVIEKKKWQKVADGMKIPKSAQDRVTKLDDIYCKYLLPYDTLSTEEREKLFEDVETDWRKRESKALERLNDSTASMSSVDSANEDEDDEDSSEEIEECIVKGRNMPLNAFYRIARNTQRMWFGEIKGQGAQGNESEGADSSEVETAFWRHVSERKRHVCVHSASIDSSGRGFGFSVAKNSPFARHPWNPKVLTNNSGSVLRALGPLMGVTIPTIHVGMLFSACCWYRDPHMLPWIEYLHTGAKKIWYGIPNELNDNFKEALSKMVPKFCKNKKIWLPSDTVMVPPEMLVANGVPLCRTVQEPGQFIIVFPKAFTSSICTGYVVSESVYFAQTTWLEEAEGIFKEIQDCCEPSMFSFERLVFSIINDGRSSIDILKTILPVMLRIREKELHYRQQLEYYGLSKKEKLPLPDNGKRKKAAKVKEDVGDFECETCRMNLFVSLMNNSQDDSTYCLPHALQFIAHKKKILKHCTLKYTYSEEELDDLIHKLEDRIEAKSKKKPSKQSD